MIKIKNLTKTYHDRFAVQDISFNIKKGEVFGFLGQNGAGKTTTIKILVGLIFPDSGSVTIGDKLVGEIETREKIGFMPEAPYFYERLTGIEFIMFCGSLFPSNKIKQADCEAILRKVGIYEARNAAIRDYSKGMKQRLGFAQALVNNPDYIFLDEPLDGLDPIGRMEVKGIIKSLKSEGKTIFFNSHILYDTEELCDEVGIIHKGKLLYKGSVKDFCKSESLESQFVSLIEQHQPTKN